MQNRLDIIVFGATGFTGKHVLPYLHKLCPNYGNGITWGIAGRSEQKLKQLLHETALLLDDPNINSIPIITADIANEDSIMQMAQKARIIINCCGPFKLYGEVVVKSCIHAGTNYVDVTAESYFEELIELKFHEAAESKGVYIVSSCGYHTIYSELSLAFLENNFPGTINSVDFFINLCHVDISKGPAVNYGTWKSAVTEISHLKSLYCLRKVRNLKPLPKLQPKNGLRLPFTKGDIDIPQKKLFPFPSPDSNVIHRTQCYFYEKNKKRPFQIRHYYLEESWINIFLFMCFGTIILIFAQFQFGRKLLLKYPKFFTVGIFSNDEVPKENCVENTKYDVYFYGKGWKETGIQNHCNMPPNKAILGRLHLDNPGYGFTCLAISLSAILILTQPSKLPAKGGVYTPGVTFSKTSFVEEFQKNGVKLDILSVKDL